MPNSLQDTINYIQPFCRYMKAGIGTNGQPILGIASLVRNIILAAPMTWAFNRSTDDSIVTTVGVQDYATALENFGFLEKASVLDPDENKIYQLKNVMNNEALAKGTVQARPESVAVQTIQQSPVIDDLIESSFLFSGAAVTSFSFTIPDTLEIGDIVAFAIEVANGTDIPSITEDSLNNVVTQQSTQTGGGDNHQFTVYTMPVTVAGTSTISFTLGGSRNVQVQGVQLRGVSTTVQLTSPVNNTGTSQSWRSTALVVTDPFTALVSFNVGYGLPVTVGNNFESIKSGVINGSPNVQLDTVGLVVTPGTYQSSFTQSTSSEWQTVLMGFTVTGDVGINSPVFRFSAVPNKIYPVNLVYQEAPQPFTSFSDFWDPIPDGLSDVYNNLCLGYYMDSCQDPRASQYISRGIAGLLARNQGLSQMDKAVFALSYMNQGAAELFNQLRTQQGSQAQQAR